MNSGNVWYFAYGSNLNISQMYARVGEWETSKKAILKGWKLVFNVNSPRWCGKAANIIQTGNENDIVYGVIYLISTCKLDVLSSYERNEPSDVEVDSEGKMLEAKTYIFDPKKPSGEPPHLYLNTMIEGLRQHGYEEDIIEKIRKTAKNS